MNKLQREKLARANEATVVPVKKPQRKESEKVGKEEMNGEV
jgi:hypothetical protein